MDRCIALAEKCQLTPCNGDTCNANLVDCFTDDVRLIIPIINQDVRFFLLSTCAIWLIHGLLVWKHQ